MHKKEAKKGFTIIELIVVIAIIAVLSGVVMASVNQYMMKARDTKRAIDIKTLVEAIRIYQTDNDGDYPPSCGVENPPGYVCSNSYNFEQSLGADQFINQLVANGYLPKGGLRDPRGNESFWLYSYSSYLPMAQYYCDNQTKVALIFLVENSESLKSYICPKPGNDPVYKDIIRCVCFY